MNPLDRRLLGLLGGASAVFVVLWLGLLLFGRSAMLRDPGTFWHIAAGRRMLATGHVIRHDPFSFTFAGRPWVADQWLAECGMAVVHRFLGWDGLLLATATILAAVYAWLAVRLARSGLHRLPTLLLLAVVLLLGVPQFHVRPLVFTIALLGVTFAWLVDVEAGRKSPRQLWWLVPLFVLWTNLHGGMLGGIATVALCTAGWSILELMDRHRGVKRGDPIFVDTKKGTVPSLAILPIALAATMLVNPYGVALPQEWLETLAMPLPTIIEEHAPLALISPVGGATLLLGAIYLAVLISVYPARPRITWLVPLAWFALALLRVRNTPLFGVAAAIGLADMLPHLRHANGDSPIFADHRCAAVPAKIGTVPCSRLGRWLERRGMLGAARPAADWHAVVVPLAAVALATMIQFGGVQLPVIGRGWARLDPACWPVAILPQLDAINQSADQPVPIFNDLNFGGFLIYYAPRSRVFIDDRCSLYGTEFLVAYDLARCNDPARIDRWQQQYGFRYALVESGGQFDQYLGGSPTWTPIARSVPATLYQLRMGTNAKVQ